MLSTDIHHQISPKYFLNLFKAIGSSIIWLIFQYLVRFTALEVEEYFFLKNNHFADVNDDVNWIMVTQKMHKKKKQISNTSLVIYGAKNSKKKRFSILIVLNLKFEFLNIDSISMKNLTNSN